MGEASQHEIGPQGMDREITVMELVSEAPKPTLGNPSLTVS